MKKLLLFLFICLPRWINHKKYFWILLILSNGAGLPFYILHAQNINITLAGQLSYGTQALSNIWGWKSPIDGKEYALVGAADGLSIVDVTNPSTPTQIVQIPPQDTASLQCVWREVKTNGNYAYITAECGQTGLQIIDLTNLPSPTLTTVNWKPKIGIDTLQTIHALHIDNGKLYLYGSNVGGGGVVVADVSATPMSPVYLGSYDNGGYIHDGYVQNDTLYAGHIWSGTVEIVNMANPANGIPLASFSTPGLFTHNTWLSSNGKICYTTDEISGGYLAAFDISNLGNITMLDAIQSNPGSGVTVHNTYIINKNGIDYAVTSWYKDGLTIVSCANPSNLIQVGNYDTSPAMSGSGYGGCWGVYPYLPSGIILASDIELGLFVLSPTYVTGINESALQAEVSVYPNPFSETATLRITNFRITDYTIILYDIYGKQLIKEIIRNSPFVISRGNLVAGIYFYRITSGNALIASGKLCAD